MTEREEVSAAGWVAHALRNEVSRVRPDTPMGQVTVRQPSPSVVEAVLPSGTTIRADITVIPGQERKGGDEHDTR